jgi:hypothetical protein
MAEATEAADPSGSEEIADPTTAVIAHSLISSAAVITNVLQSLLAYGEELAPERRRQLLEMGLTQASYLAEVLRDLARGLPSEVIAVLDAIDERRPLPDA